ncbi:hypothetical protein BFJ66_g15616 [Fusarium oxysporum f. sp. cepae]|uniref:Uncharacterized protein n=1 Tax=Fusarium oxysporum Fo47 TaxID=660027 RepID=W9JRW2_FUSOX|nr:hypothetical protein FOZG_12986 [Fusarium oxysporum Fo47]RKK31829.1 hypothetical protein BFJ67_g15039 [Fusarium oxysporum f. sp. cepae]RKK31936.1 hypothetical protein BFJ66_g15616 [Fusarium oxysporum f. sp. cepae]
MPSPFRPLTKLPIELRLQIGMLLVFHPRHTTVVYNGGLWRACKESREVILKHAHIDDWLRAQEQYFIKYRSGEEYQADWLGGEEAVHLAILTIAEEDQEWHLVAYPARDISLPNVYGTELWRIIKDFAIEFDQSWSINRPGNIYDLSEENFARGYLEKLFFDRAHHRNFDGLENIWLIDKGAMWSRHPHQYYCTSDAEGLQEVPTLEHEIVAVYRGCDAEYVEVSWEQCSHKTADGMAPSSKGFVEKLDLESDFVALPPSAQMRSSPKKDSATLARRSVEVGHGVFFSSFNHIE